MRRGKPCRRRAWPALIALVAACGRDQPPARSDTDGAVPAADSVARARETSRPQATHAVQLGSFADSTRAAALRDSLAQAGWRPVVRQATIAGAARWRVLVSPTRDSALARLVAFVLQAGKTDAVVVASGLDGVRDGGVHLTPVNRGTHGMAARVRWTLSPDRSQLLVVEDPTAVEAEPVPNGFVYASERSGAWLQMDDVWDVTPSPDWLQLAYGKAYRINSGESEPTTAQWTARARELSAFVPREVLPASGEPWAPRFARAVRARAFASSGMAIAYAIGVSFTLRVDTMTPLPDDAPRRVAGPATAGRVLMLEGWRTRWTRSGDTLGIGTGPRGSQDFSPPGTWILVRPSTGGGADSVGVAADSGRFAHVPWVEGPTLDISLPIDFDATVSIQPGRARVVAERGWIRVQRPGDATPRIVGPGRPLAATRDGRFIAAIAPARVMREYENPTILVVYQVN